MFYTHEEMKRKFGIVYFVNVLNNYRIEEHFKTDYIPFDTYDTVELARLSFIEKENSRELEKVEVLKKVVSHYDSLPFLKKILKRKSKMYSDYQGATASLKKIEERINKNIEAISNKDVLMLDTNKTYNIEYPDLSEGDKIYVVVNERNFLEEGVYEGIITRLNYMIHDSNKVSFSGVFEVNGKELRLNVGNDGNLKDGYMHHVVYRDKEQTKKDFKEEVERKIDYLNKKVNNSCAE